MNFKLLFLLFLSFYDYDIAKNHKFWLCWWSRPLSLVGRERFFQTSHIFLPNGNDDDVDDLFNSLSSMRESDLLSK